MALAELASSYPDRPALDGAQLVNLAYETGFVISGGRSGSGVETSSG